MSSLGRVLKTLFLAFRLSSAQRLDIPPASPQPLQEEPLPVEPPPPDDEENVSYEGGYDPLRETEVIFTPLSDDPLFYNLYCAQAASNLLYAKAEYHLPTIPYNQLKLFGAQVEGELIIRNWLYADPANYLFRLFRVYGYPVVVAQHVNNDSYDWYYCTLLELPQGIFGPILATFSRPAKTAAQKYREELFENNRSSGDNK